MGRSPSLRRLRSAALLLALTLAACGEAEPPEVQLVSGRVHDLVALLPHAEVSGRSAYRATRVASLDDADPRDGLLGLRLFSGSGLRFEDLEVVGDTTLSFQPGLFAPHQQPGATGAAARPPVRLVARLLGQDGAGDQATLLELALPLDATSFDEQGLAKIQTLTLSARTPGERRQLSVELRCEALDDENSEWLAVFHPTLRNDGVRGPVSARPLSLERLEHDLVSSLDAATQIEEAREGAVKRATIDPARGVAAAGGVRATLVLPAPSAVGWELPLPKEGAELRFSYGIDTDRGWRLGGDGMRFGVRLNGELVWESTLLAPTLQRDRGWKEARIDLSAFADQSPRLELFTDALDDDQHDIGGFADTRIVRSVTRPRRLVSEAPTVVVLLVDTLRADHVTPELMPQVSAWSERGLRYRSARSVSSWTWPATASLLTGLPPTTHRVRDATSSYLADGFTTVAEAFAEGGYTTGAFVANLLVGRADNFDQGFETFVHTPNARGRALNQAVERWLDNTEGLARFLYVHSYDPHAPYLPPGEPLSAAEAARDTEILSALWKQSQAGEVDMALAESWAASQRARYRREVADADLIFGELMSLLESRVEGELIVAFTSDHGEEFLDHGQVSHGPHLYDETLAAPLWIAGTGPSAPPPAVIDALVETRGLPSALLELAGLPALPGELVRSLPLSPQGARAEPAFSQTFQGIEVGVPQRVEKRAVIHAGLKLIHTPVVELAAAVGTTDGEAPTGSSPSAEGSAARRVHPERVELYELISDPGERHDVSGAYPERVRQLREQLDNWLQRTTRARGAREEIDPGSAALMEAIGYLNSSRGEGGALPSDSPSAAAPDQRSESPPESPHEGSHEGQAAGPSGDG